MQPSNFNRPTQHPFGMLAGEGLSHTSEAESLLTWMLIQSIDQGSFSPISTNNTHPTLVRAGLLEEVGERQYKLTRKSLGLLWSHFGKMELD